MGRRFGFALLAALLLTTGCGGEPTHTAPTPVVPAARQPRVLLDVTVMVPGPEGCSITSTPVDFIGEAGAMVTIEATGPAAMSPAIVVYGPDWATQLTGSTTSGPGMQTLMATPAQSGPHHVEVCAINSVGGATRIRVTTGP